MITDAHAQTKSSNLICEKYGHFSIPSHSRDSSLIEIGTFRNCLDGNFFASDFLTSPSQSSPLKGHGCPLTRWCHLTPDKYFFNDFGCVGLGFFDVSKTSHAPRVIPSTGRGQRRFSSQNLSNELKPAEYEFLVLLTMDDVTHSESAAARLGFVSASGCFAIDGRQRSG